MTRLFRLLGQAATQGRALAERQRQQDLQELLSLRELAQGDRRLDLSERQMLERAADEEADRIVRQALASQTDQRLRDLAGETADLKRELAGQADETKRELSARNTERVLAGLFARLFGQSLGLGWSPQDSRAVAGLGVPGLGTPAGVPAAAPASGLPLPRVTLQLGRQGVQEPVSGASSPSAGSGGGVLTQGSPKALREAEESKSRNDLRGAQTRVAEATVPLREAQTRAAELGNQLKEIQLRFAEPKIRAEIARVEALVQKAAVDTDAARASITLREAQAAWYRLQPEFKRVQQLQTWANINSQIADRAADNARADRAEARQARNTESLIRTREASASGARPVDREKALAALRKERTALQQERARVADRLGVLRTKRDSLTGRPVPPDPGAVAALQQRLKEIDARLVQIGKDGTLLQRTKPLPRASKTLPVRVTPPPVDRSKALFPSFP